MNLHANDFELLGVARQFRQDAALLEARWKALQRQNHPDRFTSEDAQAQRVALQWSVRINEAYQRLKNPVTRAAYLCGLAGVAIHGRDHPPLPRVLLMQQMQWREMLEEARSAGDLDRLRLEIDAEQHRMVTLCARLLDDESDPNAAAEAVRALLFVDKLLRDLEQAYERFDG